MPKLLQPPSLLGLVLAAVPHLCISSPSADAWHMAGGPLATPWAADVSPTNALPDYPRPQMVRPDWQNLNGLWEFAITPDTTLWPAAYEGTILVPFPVESALSGVMRPLNDRSTLWYRRTFTVPAGWTGRRVLLRFGAVDWQARVFLNGRQIGLHRGGYDAFAFDITDALSQGVKQELVVAVSDPTEGDQPRGKQSLRPEGIFYSACSGIWQTVWLEPVPIQGIVSIHLTPDPGAHVLRLRIATREQREGMQVEAIATADGREAGRVSGAVNADVVLPLTSVRLWSPQDPFLYDLRVVLKQDGVPVDEVRSYFGMRSVGLRDDGHGITRIALNDEFLFQVGALDQGFWPDGIYTAATDEALRHDLNFLKAAGFNVVRKHVKVEPDRWYYWCDKLGLLVWQDMPSGNNNTAEARVRFEAELDRMVGQLHNHPCIITWVLFNEGWGQFDTERLSRSLKSLDPSRLVDSASGWTDKQSGDLIDAHSYPLPESPAPETRRALVIGEFGGLGLTQPGHQWSSYFWSYQVMSDEQALEAWYYALLKEIWSQNQSRGLSAAVYTQITDVETECNGLLTYDRRVPKIPAERLLLMNRGEVYRQTMSVLLTNAVFGVPTWRYTIDKPDRDWTSQDFDDRLWKEGPGGFGTATARASIVRTAWTTSDIWLRRSFVLDKECPPGARFYLHHDNGIEVYLNGVLALATKSYLVDYALFDIAPAALATLHTGTNQIAVHCNQTIGPQFVDVGIVAFPSAPAGGLQTQ
jgi:hypothetical protein